jgi:hypothetical protein
MSFPQCIRFLSKEKVLTYLFLSLLRVTNEHWQPETLKNTSKFGQVASMPSAFCHLPSFLMSSGYCPGLKKIEASAGLHA